MAYQDNRDDMESLIGQQLDNFRVIERIGAGGMATVFRAYQPSLDRYVAIKVLPTKQAQDPIFFKRFVQEARSIARLAHPNIVHIYNFGEEGDIKYIAMEYVDGGTLKQRLGKPLPVRQAADFVIQAAQGLACAHSNGIIHRDIKPANMLLRKNGHLLLTDFGLAKILEDTTNITRTGARLGTPHYMSPEQGTGRPVDARTDIYSLGIVLFQCLAGEPPFSADNPLSMSVKHLQDPLPVQKLTINNSVPDPIVQIILKMAAKQPNERYQSAHELIDALSNAVTATEAISRRNVLGHLAAPVAPPPSATPPALEQQNNNAGRACFRCGEPNKDSRLFCTVCGYDLSNKRASADRYKAANGLPLLARLSPQSGPLAGRALRFHQDTTTIGRATGNDLVVTGRTVSRYHAHLNFVEGRWYVEDLQSANGTKVNGKRIQERTFLKDGDLINFGDERVVFNIVTGNQPGMGNIANGSRPQSGPLQGRSA
ncbi:MAG: protein kinase [Chloroflexota bacterium]|nr:protein kinase [Chloroflexota bacterium]